MGEAAQPKAWHSGACGVGAPRSPEAVGSRGLQHPPASRDRPGWSGKNTPTFTITRCKVATGTIKLCKRAQCRVLSPSFLLTKARCFPTSQQSGLQTVT